jgi:hypothetical protein
MPSSSAVASIAFTGAMASLTVLRAAPFAAIPHVESEHLAKFGKDAAAKGRVPWKVGEVYGELVQALRSGDTARALERAAVLGHFIGDAHVPLHSATNYDGQQTGQTGFHGRWESAMVERFERQIDAAAKPQPAARIGDPVKLTFDILLESYGHYPRALASDLASRESMDLAETPQDDRYDDAYYSKLYEREGNALARRLSQAATRVGSLWLQAWQDAGRPVVDASFRIPYVRRQNRGVLLSLDGGAAVVFDDAIARGLMPNLAAVRSRGAVARGSTVSVPSKTAPGHAELFTGAWGETSGISG